jgi:serine/threonine-protein kinase
MIGQGTTIQGRYRIDRQVGEGGMAVVYVGRDLLLNRNVAIKVLRAQYAADPQFRVRFRREAQSAAGFSHPNIVDVYDVGETAGEPWFVMAYVPGQTLKQIVATEAPFHPDDVAGLLQQVCSALDYAHERGFVHRDVKPQNILVDPDGHAVVADFGIAKGLADADLTQTAAGLGTVHYLSPEQAGGGVATPASDVYAVGVVAFEMLTGRLPFEADTPVGVAMRHLHERPPAPSDLLPSIPPAVDAIVLRALDKDPSRRFPSAGALAKAMTYWRQYRTPALAGDPGATTPLGTGALRTLAGSAPVPAHGPQVVPLPARAGRGEGGGWLTWAVGGLILAGLAALIVLGGQLAINLRDDPGSNGPAVSDFETPPPEPAVVVEPTAVIEPTAVAVEPTRPPSPTIAPAEPTPPALAGVPDLVGRTVDEATVRLASQGLRIAVGPTMASDNVPEGSIVVQDPPPGGVVEPGTVVTVRVSAAEEIVDIAALELPGKPAQIAVVLLEQAGLVPVRVEQANNDVLPGFVFAVEPSEEAPVGSEVRVFVNSGDRAHVKPGMRAAAIELPWHSGRGSRSASTGWLPLRRGTA